MNLAIDRFVHWLLDLHLLSSLLLLAGLLILNRLKQPAWRIAVARSVVVGLATLAVVAAAPGWPRSGWVLRVAAEPASTPSTFISRFDVGPNTPAPSLVSPGPVVETSGVTVPSAFDSSAAPMTSASTRPTLSWPDWRWLVVAAYSAGVSLNLAWLALGAIQAARLRHSVRMAIARVPTLLARRWSVNARRKLAFASALGSARPWRSAFSCPWSCCRRISPNPSPMRASRPPSPTSWLILRTATSIGWRSRDCSP